MTKFDSIDFINHEGVEGLEGMQGRGDRPKKVKRTLDSDKVSTEDITSGFSDSSI